MNLANLYDERISGAHSENVEDAIKAYQDALSVTSRTRDPDDWAKIKLNLGVTLFRSPTRAPRGQSQTCNTVLQ